MNAQTQKIMIEGIADSLDIPDSAYEKAEKRYKDLGDWFDRREGRCFSFSPHIYPQGSFRLGTVVRPLNEKHEYDLDVGCRLRQGISKTTHTQKQLKTLVGIDLEDYRKARKIQNPLDERNRCWRLEYVDEMNFHMDVVPSIPEETRRLESLQEAMIKSGKDKFLAQAVAKFAGSITDKRLRNYELITTDWLISNSEGYAKWFESRMSLAKALLEKRVFEAKVAQVDDLPARKWKSPLQRCIQILKCHRNIMFEKDPDGKPISIIITTLAAGAYQGEDNVESAMQTILSRMEGLVYKQSPRVPNPVNPVEDFADKWSTTEGLQLELEKNFWLWLNQAKADFDALGSSGDVQDLAEQATKKFGARLNAGDLRKKLGAPISISMVSQGLAEKTPKSPVDHRGGGRFG